MLSRYNATAGADMNPVYYPNTFPAPSSAPSGSPSPPPITFPSGSSGSAGTSGTTQTKLPAYSGSTSNPNIYAPGIMSLYWQTGNLADRFTPLASDNPVYGLPTMKDLVGSPAERFIFQENAPGWNGQLGPVNNPGYDPNWKWGQPYTNAYQGTGIVTPQTVTGGTGTSAGTASGSVGGVPGTTGGGGGATGQSGKSSTGMGAGNQVVFSSTPQSTMSAQMNPVYYPNTFAPSVGSPTSGLGAYSNRRPGLGAWNRLPSRLPGNANPILISP